VTVPHTKVNNLLANLTLKMDGAHNTNLLVYMVIKPGIKMTTMKILTLIYLFSLQKIVLSTVLGLVTIGKISSLEYQSLTDVSRESLLPLVPMPRTQLHPSGIRIILA